MPDPGHFDAFYASAVRRVTSQVFLMTGSAAEAEDATAEAFARAWQQWRKVSTYHNPEAWVRTVAWRISVSNWRKMVNRTLAHRRHGPPGDPPGMSPDSVAIVAALRQIPPAQRQAVVLHYLVGLSIAQIAQQTGASEGAIRVRLSRGRKALTPYLADDDLPGGTPGREVPRHAS
jgi:RNA polymerase sigma-70 factor (ECF subfamily)